MVFFQKLVPEIDKRKTFIHLDSKKKFTSDLDLNYDARLSDGGVDIMQVSYRSLSSSRYFASLVTFGR